MTGNRDEFNPVAGEIPFDNSESDFSDEQDNVEAAIKGVRRYNATQISHGFVLPSYGFLPVYYNHSNSQFELANASTIGTAADLVVVDLPDDDTITIQEGGYLHGAHGLNVGEWYALRAGFSGLVLPSNFLDGLNKQYICFVIDANTLVFRIDPITEDATFVPQDISILNDWTQGGNPTINVAGTNRLLIVSVTWEDQSGETFVSSMEIGGQTASLVDEQTITSGLQQGSSICYWTDAQIEAMTNNTLTINWSAGAPTFFQTYDAIIQHVDQTNPIIQTATDFGTGGTDTMDTDVNTLSGGYALIVASGGNQTMGFTNNGTGWTRKVNITITSADGVVDDKLISSAATPENLNMSITGSNRHVMVGASFRRKEV